jgi:hypothetical protein
MEINASMNVGSVNNPILTGRSLATPPQAAATDSFTSSSALQEASQNTPDTRAEAVARGQALVSDSGYPSGDTIRVLSNFLASRLQGGSN